MSGPLAKPIKYAYEFGDELPFSGTAKLRSIDLNKTTRFNAGSAMKFSELKYKKLSFKIHVRGNKLIIFKNSSKTFLNNLLISGSNGKNMLVLYMSSYTLMPPNKAPYSYSLIQSYLKQ